MKSEDNRDFLTDIDLAEQSFFDPNMLSVDYVKRLRQEFMETRHSTFNNHHRNYPRLLSALEDIFFHNELHGRRYVRRMKAEGNDVSSGDAIFAEIIIYRAHLPLIAEGHLISLDLDDKECDLIVSRSDGTQAFLEVFSISPVLNGELGTVTSIVSHTQAAMSSVRQKLLRKVEVQKQMIKPRENWAVIELNSTAIAGAFTVLSSLSGGYKITIDISTMKTVSEGYDWSESIFNLDNLQFLRGVIHFDLGNYADRRVLLNPRWTNPGAPGA